jgi:hypothetical protein
MNVQKHHHDDFVLRTKEKYNKKSNDYRHIILSRLLSSTINWRDKNRKRKPGKDFLRSNETIQCKRRDHPSCLTTRIH